MSRSIDPATARHALAQRLRAAAEVLFEEPLPAPHPDSARDAAFLLDRLVRQVHGTPTDDAVWLLYVAVSTCLPTSDDVQAVRRYLELSTVQGATIWLLDLCMAAARGGSPDRELRVVTDAVVVDVDHSAQHDLHTGIQQVVRHVVPVFERDHDVVLVVWLPGCTAQRMITAGEHDRVVRWGTMAGVSEPAASDGTALPPLVVPWRSTLVLAEVPPLAACARLSALAQYSGNSVSAIGYDCVPVVSADLVPIVEPNRFAQYLSIIKHARHVAGISISATTEFRGFVETLPTQGRTGPDVVECRLPDEGFQMASATTTAAPADDLSTVLSVGSFEPRKNHLALLYAAERLWRDGLAFRLRLVGGSGWGNDVPDMVRRLQADGYPVTIETKVAAAELADAYRVARFTVFASVHEGYGLPVAESIAFGTPVITSDYGSTREVGEGRGAELIDPRDDDALVRAMRTLLTDDDRLAELQAQTHARAVRSWEQYADEVWHCLVSRQPATATGDRGR